MSQTRNSGDLGSWSAFLIIAFAVVGLVGALATFAAQIPFDRAMARDHALDQALVAARSADPHAALEALRPALGDSATTLLPAAGPGVAPDFVDRVSAERRRMWSAFYAEAKDIGFRLRIVITVFTLAAALFGVMILSVVRRQARPAPPVL